MHQGTIEQTELQNEQYKNSMGELTHRAKRMDEMAKTTQGSRTDNKHKTSIKTVVSTAEIVFEKPSQKIIKIRPSK